MDKEIKGHIKTADLEIQNFKIANKKERIIEGFFTTQDIDRGGEVSLTSAFTKTMPEYMKNPILTYMHDLGKVMGKVLDYKIFDGKGVWIKAQVAKDVKWIDEEIWPLIEQGIIKGFSYGYATKDEEKGLIDDKEVNFLKEVDVFEIAGVPLPMNSNTLFTLSSTGAVKAIQLEERVFNTPEVKLPNMSTSDIENKEELDVEKIDELLQSVKTLTDSVKKFSEKFDSLNEEKIKEFSVTIAEITASKIKEMQETEQKSKEEQESESKEMEAKKQEEKEVLDGINEVSKAMANIVELLTIKKEENKNE